MILDTPKKQHLFFLYNTLFNLENNFFFTWTEEFTISLDIVVDSNNQFVRFSFMNIDLILDEYLNIDNILEFRIGEFFSRVSEARLHDICSSYIYEHYGDRRLLDLFPMHQGFGMDIQFGENTSTVDTKRTYRVFLRFMIAIPSVSRTQDEIARWLNHKLNPILYPWDHCRSLGMACWRFILPQAARYKTYLFYPRQYASKTRLEIAPNPEYAESRTLIWVLPVSGITSFEQFYEVAEYKYTFLAVFSGLVVKYIDTCLAHTFGELSHYKNLYSYFYGKPSDNSVFSEFLDTLHSLRSSTLVRFALKKKLMFCIYQNVFLLEPTAFLIYMVLYNYMVLHNIYSKENSFFKLYDTRNALSKMVKITEEEYLLGLCYAGIRRYGLELLLPVGPLRDTPFEHLSDSNVWQEIAVGDFLYFKREFPTIFKKMLKFLDAYFFTMDLSVYVSNLSDAQFLQLLSSLPFPTKQLIEDTVISVEAFARGFPKISELDPEPGNLCSLFFMYTTSSFEFAMYDYQRLVGVRSPES